MSTRPTGPPSPATALKAYGKILFSEIVSVVVLSVLFVFALFPVVTIGAALVSLIDTFYSSVAYTGTGGGLPRQASSRASNFVASIWDYLRVGLAFGVVFVVIVTGILTYFFAALAGSSTVVLFVGVFGVYAVVAVLVVLLRAANLIVHAENDDDTERPGFVAAVRQAYGTVTEHIAYEAVHVVAATAIVLFALLIPFGVGAFLFPGMITLLEVVFYEELDGVGAETLLYALADPQE
jgi:hypothetical protein